MMQFLQKKFPEPALSNSVRVNIYDKMIPYSDETVTDLRPIFNFTSQLSGNGFNTMPLTANYTNKERYVGCDFFTWTTAGLSIGYLKFGTTDLPYGLYDVTVYQNDFPTNLDPTGLRVLWNGLANVKQLENPAVEYTDYDTNDADTESVYITF